MDRLPAEPPLWYAGIAAFLVLTGVAIDDLLRSGHDGRLIAAGLVMIGLFLIVFMHFALTGRVGEAADVRLRLLVLALPALGVSLLMPGELLFLVTAGALAGLYLRPRSAVIALAATTGAVLALTLVEESASDAFGHAAQAAAIGFFCFGWARLQEANLALESARSEVHRLAVADERVRFARELHDLLGHTLSVLRVKSELASRIVLDDPVRAQHEMTEVERVARDALTEVRAAVSGYHPDLTQELRNSQATLSGLGIRADVTAASREIDGQVGETLAWVVREATTNVVRHSDARRCWIRLRCEDGIATMEISDDGSAGSAPVVERNGLRGMRERVTAAGGELHIEGGTGTGLRIRASVPVHP